MEKFSLQFYDIDLLVISFTSERVVIETIENGNRHWFHGCQGARVWGNGVITTASHFYHYKATLTKDGK